MRRRRPVALALVVPLWMLAACTGSNDPGTSPAKAGTTGVAEQLIDSTRKAPAAPIQGAVRGGTVTALVDDSNWPKLLDPSNLYDLIPNSVMSGLVTRSLTQYAYDPARHTMVLVPDIATDTGRPNADYTRWTFTIRHGVRFENGTAVTADDVAFGIKRSLDRADFPENPAYGADYFLNGAAYKGPYQSGSSYSGVVVDGDTLTIKMSRPFPDMPYYAAFTEIGPIPDIGSNPATYGLHPLATGPYKISKYTRVRCPSGIGLCPDTLSLVRNTYWNPNTDPGRHAYPDRYVFRLQTPAAQADALILGNSAAGQTTLSTSSVLAADYPRALRLHRLTVGPSPCTLMWLPDYRKMTDIRVREALGYAYPYRAIDRAYGLIPGVTALAGASILPPGFPGRRNYRVLGIRPGHTDPQKAQALLRQAGYSPGQYRVTFGYYDDPLQVRIKNLRVRALEAAGFKASPYHQATYDQIQKVEYDPGGPLNVREGGWCSDWPSGSTWFPPQFQAKARDNHAYFSEPAFDTEMARIPRSPIAKQPAEWAQLDKTLMTRYYPAIVTIHTGDALPHGVRIHGMNHDNALGAPTWKDINVAP
jgi:peptide/nickel transport system substrate-binding protein